LNDTVAADRRGLTLARDRFRHGLDSFLQVLTAQQNLLSAQEQLVQGRLQLTTDVVSLYRRSGATPG
jgi:outer membrane protein TolC